MSERINDVQPEGIDEMQAEAAAALTSEPMWYVVHTYSGYENKVKDTLEKSIKSSGMENYIFEVRVPVEEVTEIKKGKRVKAVRKVFPGYVIVKMIKTNQSWYVVRNTRGVTGFVGPESKPVALSPEEVESMLSSQSLEAKYSIAVGEDVRILSGPLENFTGTVEEIDALRAKMRVKVKMFLGREMQVELDFNQVEKAE